MSNRWESVRELILVVLLWLVSSTWALPCPGGCLHNYPKALKLQHKHGVANFSVEMGRPGRALTEILVTCHLSARSRSREWQLDLALLCNCVENGMKA